MKLSTVIASVNNNSNYYSFIPKQILFWNSFKIRFITIFIGEKIPEELQAYSENIILWNKNIDLHSAYLAQHIRIFYPALLHLPENEMVMITDMDMLPMNDTYYTSRLDNYKTEDFIYYRNIDGNQIYMCYNAAHPFTWAKVFQIENEEDIERKLNENYHKAYDGIPGSSGWYSDQEIMYHALINYPYLHVLNRHIHRLEVDRYREYLSNSECDFISKYDDAHFHRSYFDNESLILDAEQQLLKIKMVCLPFEPPTNCTSSIQNGIKVITFSLWGDKPQYNIGAIINAKDAIEMYPEFECWFYIHSETVPRETIDVLSSMSNVKIIWKEGDLDVIKPMMWRFEAIDDPSVEIMMSRDTDTRLLQREKTAVDIWLNSDFEFHIMRDHPYHDTPILGGMFGTKKIPEISSWSNLIEVFTQRGDRDYDQSFLRDVIYPIIKDRSIIHATFYRIESNAEYFPIEYDTEYRFVGEYIDHKESRNNHHIQDLKNAYRR